MTWQKTGHAGCVFVAGFVFAAGLMMSACVVDAPVVPDCARPLMIGHRGTPNHRPENTLIAFDYALENGGDGIEIDLRSSSDGHLVAMHDTTIDRTTNGSGPVGAHSLVELQALDAGSWFDENYANAVVPSLTEIIEATDKYGKIYMLDIREKAVLDAALDEVESRGMGDRTLVALWDIELIKRACEHPASVMSVYFINSLDSIPDDAPDCLQVIRYRGVGAEAPNISQTIAERGFESMVGGWSVEWGVTRWGIADALHRQIPWLDEQRPAECKDSPE